MQEPFKTKEVIPYFTNQRNTFPAAVACRFKSNVVHDFTDSWLEIILRLPFTVSSILYYMACFKILLVKK